MELFEQMQAKGCKPDSVTYGGLILAFEKGDQWRRALAAFDQMKNNNCRPDSVVYNTVVGALWNTGVVWAQAKAVQVWHQLAAAQWTDMHGITVVGRSKTLVWCEPRLRLSS